MISLHKHLNSLESCFILCYFSLWNISFFLHSVRRSVAPRRPGLERATPPKAPEHWEETRSPQNLMWKLYTRILFSDAFLKNQQLLLYYSEAWKESKPLLLVFSALALLTGMRQGSCASCFLQLLSGPPWQPGPWRKSMGPETEADFSGFENNNRPISEINLRSKWQIAIAGQVHAWRLQTLWELCLDIVKAVGFF